MPKVVLSNTKGLIQESGEAAADLAPGIAFGAQAVTAAGGDLAGAAAISATGGSLVVVSGADNAKGVVLPALADVPAGQLFMVQNQVADKTLEVYPAANDSIGAIGDGNPVTIAASSMLICVKADATQWIGAEPAAASA
jgi:hypothetical protein